MFVTCCTRTPLLQLAVVCALLAVSPSSALPLGIALAAMGLLGTTVLVRRWRLEERPAVVSLNWHAANRTDSRP